MKEVFDLLKDLYFKNKIAKKEPISKEDATLRKMALESAFSRLVDNDDFKLFFDWILVENYLNSLYLHRTEPDIELRKEYSGWCACYEFIIDMILKRQQIPKEDSL
jgi:hypothetical protein